MKTVEVILATTHRVEAYGGIQLSRDVLEGLAEAVLKGSLPMRRNHDARQQFKAVPIDAGVRERPDGEFEAWALLEVDVDDWDAFQEELTALNAPGGMSFSFTEPLAKIESAPGDAGVLVSICADAHHFSDGQLMSAGEELASATTVQLERLYQFSFVPPALVVVHFLLQGAAQIPPGVVANYLYDSIKHFFRPDGTSPAINLEVSEEPGKRRVTACIPESTPDGVAKRAIAAFEKVAGQRGVWEFTDGEGWRMVHDD